MEALVEGLGAITNELGTTLAQLAIAWVLHQPGVTAAIAGSRNGGHLEENADAAAWTSLMSCPRSNSSFH